MMPILHRSRNLKNLFGSVRMKYGLIQLAKDLGLAISMEAIKAECFSDTKCGELFGSLAKDDALTVKIIVTGMKVNEDPELVNHLLVCYAQTANDYNIRLIFKILKPNTEESIELCKKYVLIPAYRSAVLPLFNKHGLFWEDAHIYNVPALEAYLRRDIPLDNERSVYFDRILRGLFKTINEKSLSITHKVIKRLLEYDTSAYMPELTSEGLANAIKYGLFGNNKQILGRASIFSSSERVRAESLICATGFTDIFEWFKYNQYIEDVGNQSRIINSFGALLSKLDSEKINRCESMLDSEKVPAERMNTNEFCSIFMHRVVIPMCNSQKLCRRLLGAKLLVIIAENLESIDEYKPLINRMIYDKSHEIRNSVAVFCNKMGCEYNFPIINLFSHHYYLILGATHYMKIYDSRSIFNLFKSLITGFIRCGKLGKLPTSCASDGFASLADDYSLIDIKGKLDMLVNLPVSGFIHYFSEMKYESTDFDFIVKSMYNYTLEKNDVLSWRTLKECCYYFYVRGDTGVLMSTLLVSDHFGITSYLKPILSIESSDVPEFLSLGLSSLSKKKNNTRRSGGLSVYFSVLAGSKGSYWRVRDGVLDLLCPNWRSGDVLSFCTDEATSFHCLNSLISLIDDFLFDDVFFYFDLAFACLLHISFSIRNCGCSIFSILVKKILQKFKTMEAFLSVHGGIREKLHSSLLKGISENNHYIVYFILVIYSRLGSLTPEEISVIQECIRGKELIALKAKSILSGNIFSNDLSHLPIVEFCKNSDERERLFILFRTLDLGDRTKIEAARCYIKQEYHLDGAFSNEYLRHKLVELVCSMGHGEYFRARICETPSRIYLSSDALFEEEAVGNEPDVEYELSLLDLYSNTGISKLHNLN